MSLRIIYNFSVSYRNTYLGLIHGQWMKTFFVFIFIGLNFSMSYAASFPCSRASTEVEKLICDDPKLSSMDEEMANLYRKALSNSGYPAKIKREQREWLNSYRNTCRSEKCLLIAYAARLETLGSTSSLASGYSNGTPNRSPSDSQPAYRTEAVSSDDEVALVQSGGVFEVPVIVNEVLKINFILDSGASDVSISPDVALTLLKTGTISQTDWLPGTIYTFADGSSAKSARFTIRSIRLGNRILRNVTCSIAGNIDAPMLLGQSALHKLGSYQIDYRRGTLIFR